MRTNLKKRAIVLTILVLVMSLVVTACGGSKKTEEPKEQPKELVVYSGRNEKLVQPVLDEFQKQTGIKVVLRSGKATELAAVISEEQKAGNPQADIYVANDAGALEKLRLAGALEAYLSDKVKSVPEDLRATDGSWTAVTARARAIMYNKNLIKESGLPKSIFDLTDPKWKGQVAMAQTGNESVVANITSLRLLKGDAGTEKFLEGLKNNEIVLLGGHTDVRKAVGKGEFKLGWVNHYYYHLQLNEAADNQVGIIYPDQGPKDMGVVVNISGVAVVKGGKNADNAKKFVDFLLTPETQKLFAELNYEMPVIAGVPVKDAKPLNEYKRAPVSLAQFGAEWDKTVQLIDKVGLVNK